MFEFVFPWKKPPLSMNDRLHHMEKARLTKTIRKVGYAHGLDLPKNVKHITVELIWEVKDNRRRDDENPVATLKPYCDGLVDAGVVPDDTRKYMKKIMPEIANTGRERLIARISVEED